MNNPSLNITIENEDSLETRELVQVCRENIVAGVDAFRQPAATFTSLPPEMLAEIMMNMCAFDLLRLRMVRVSGPFLDTDRREFIPA